MYIGNIVLGHVQKYTVIYQKEVNNVDCLLIIAIFIIVFLLLKALQLLEEKK